MSVSKLRGLFEYNMYRLSKNDIQKCLKRMQQRICMVENLSCCARAVIETRVWAVHLPRVKLCLEKLIWFGWLLVARDPETNSKFAFENCWLKYDFFFLGQPIFTGFCCYVSFRECIFQSTWVSLAFSSHHFGGPPGLRLVAWRTFKSQCWPVENDLPWSTVWMDGQTVWSSKGPQMDPNGLACCWPLTISMELLQSKTRRNFLFFDIHSYGEHLNDE